MDEIKEDTLSDRCIILTPEDLAKFGVKLEHPSSTSNQKSDSNPKFAKEQPVEKSEDNQTNLASCSKNTKNLITYKRRRSKVSLNSKETKVSHQQANIGKDDHTRKNLTHSNLTVKSLKTYRSKRSIPALVTNDNSGEKIDSYSSPDVDKKTLTMDIVLPKQENTDILIHTRQSLTDSNTAHKGLKTYRPKRSVPALVTNDNSGENIGGTIYVKSDQESLKFDGNDCQEVKTTKPVTKNINSNSSPDVSKKLSAMDIVLLKQKNIAIVNHTRECLSVNNTTDKGYCSKKDTKNKTKENSEFLNNGGVSEEKIKYAENSSSSISKNKLSPISKQQERSRESPPLVANDSSELLPTPEVCKKNFSSNDSSSKLDNALDLGYSKTSDTVVQKRKRGRPRKSVLDHVNDGIKSKKRSKGRINKIVDSDVSFNSDSSDDSDSEPLIRSRTKKRGKGRIRPITDSDSSFCNGNSSCDEFIPKQKHSKVEISKENSTTEILILNDVNMLHDEGNESSLPEKNTTPRKRGRPKKNSLEANKTASTPAVVKQNKVDEPVITTSKRGRKRKEVNYSLLENPDFSESRTSMKIASQPKNEHYDSPHEIKIEAEGIHYPPQELENKDENTEQVHETCNEVAEGDSIEKQYMGTGNVTKAINEAAEGNSMERQYKWTGNVTKAINQMFSAIKNVSIVDSGHDPLLGKTKRIGKGNADILDKDGSTICMVCNETIPNPQWPKHKSKVHYNLAWRKGEVCLELSNEEFVLKTLKELIRERKSVKCNRCSEKFKNAKKFASHLEVCNGVVNSGGFVTCAVCESSMEKGKWHYHNYRQHNNLAWREGDPPLDLEDQDSVIRILNGLYKARKPLHCEKCGLQKKSVLGFLSHKSTCQKSGEELENMKVSCDLCGKRILPVSMDYHLKSHETQKAKYDLVNSSYFDVNVDVSGQRRAAKQALQVISSIRGQVTEESKYYSSQCDFQDSFVSDILSKSLNQQSSIKCIFPDCPFSGKVVEDMVDHMNSCEQKPDQYFVCKMCLSCCGEESKIHEHIRAEHDKSFKGDVDTEFQIEGEQNNSEDDAFLDDEERDRKRMRFIGKQKMLNQSNYRVKPYFLLPYKQNPDQILYQHSYRWMLEFCDKNYKFNLYQYLRNDQPWQVLDCDILSNYLPKKTQSCDIAAKLITVGDSPDFKELTFKKLDILEIGALYEDDITIYCGGPISCFAWLPTPYNQNTYNQVLAVAVFNSMDSCYTIDKNYHEPCVIQFWDFGILDVHEKNVSKPSLLFGMAVPYGPIWHLEWCPSGCLDCFIEDATCRLGLLAVAGSDSCAYIYSIDNVTDSNDRGFIYKGEPVLKLQLESVRSTLEGQNYYPTRISWSKADGHQYMAVGYSTGLLALYDLQNESLLLQRGDKSGTNIVFPYKTFQAHVSSITALTLSHLGGGNKFLFSASFDRTSVFWDLSTVTKLAPTKRNNISDGVWLTQWPTYLVAEDESTYNDKARAHSYYRALRHLMSPDTSCFTFATSGINTLSYSDWLNTLLHGSNGGEVMAQITNRMFCNIEHRIFKLCYPRCIFSTTKLVKKDSYANDVAVTYDEAERKYKVAFFDYNLNNINNTPNNFGKNKLNEDNLSECDIREYKLQSVNKIAFNPNPHACSFYVIGYQAGFVRLKWIEFVSPLLITQQRRYS